MSEGACGDLARIYDAYEGKVRAYAAKLLGPAEADDVSQEVFIKVGRSLDALADPTKLASWLWAVTLNTVRDVARKRSARPAADGPMANVADAAAATPEEAAIRNEMVACYVDYVKRLPRNYHEVYALREFEDLSNDEIARRLSLSLATVKIRLHRARARLHEELRRDCRCYVNDRGELMAEPKERRAS